MKLRGGLLGGDTLFRKNEALSDKEVQALMKQGSKYGLTMTREEATASTCGSSALSIITAIWMEKYFKLTGIIFRMFQHSLTPPLIGDPMPNTDGEIHLDKQEKKSIWLEYRNEFVATGRDHLSYQSFNQLWAKAFPHVRIRVYKQVSGKIDWQLIILY